MDHEIYLLETSIMPAICGPDEGASGFGGPGLQRRADPHPVRGHPAKKLALATALATGAKLLDFDEPICQPGPRGLCPAFQPAEKLNCQGLAPAGCRPQAPVVAGVPVPVVLMDKEGDLGSKSIPGERLDD